MNRVARVSGFAEARTDLRACMHPRTARHRQRPPVRIAKRLRARFRQTRPAGDLHRTRCDCHCGFSRDDLQRCAARQETPSSVLCCLRPRHPASQRKTRPGLLAPGLERANAQVSPLPRICLARAGSRARCPVWRLGAPLPLPAVSFPIPQRAGPLAPPASGLLGEQRPHRGRCSRWRDLTPRPTAGMPRSRRWSSGAVAPATVFGASCSRSTSARILFNTWRCSSSIASRPPTWGSGRVISLEPYAAHAGGNDV